MRQRATPGQRFTTGPYSAQGCTNSTDGICGRCDGSFSTRMGNQASDRPQCGVPACAVPEKPRPTRFPAGHTTHRDCSACRGDPDVAAGQFGEDVEGPAAVFGRG